MFRIARLGLLVAALAVPLGAAAEPLRFPPNSLWIEAGQVHWQGPDLRLPRELSENRSVTQLFAVGAGKVVWIEALAGGGEEPSGYRLHLADLQEGTSRRILDGPEALGGDPAARLEAANLRADGSALWVRLRLPGTGYFSEVREITLADPPQVSLLENATVWDSQSEEGTVKAAASWATVPEAGGAGPERHYGVLLVSKPGLAEGRLAWEGVAAGELPPWQERYITSVAVAPEGSRIAYLNPRGLWLYRLAGDAPTPRLELAPGTPLTLEQVVWSPDGAGLYLQARRTPEGPALLYYLPVEAGAPRLVQAEVEGLCVLARHRTAGPPE
jgi:hypothetical protein